MSRPEPVPGGELSAERRELLDLWLARPEPHAPPHVLPSTLLEQVLAAIWQDALEVSSVGIDDDYFALGGDSIRAIIVVARAQDAGIPFSTQDLFDAPTVRELARRIDGDLQATGDSAGALQAGAAAAADPVGPLPLTAMQAGMVFHALSDPGCYVVQATCQLAGDLDLPQLAQAWQLVADRRPELRRYLDLGAAEPRQLTAGAVRVPVVLADWRAASPAEQAAKLDSYLTADRNRSLDPTAAPLLRAAFFQLSERTCQCVLTHHHLLLDGWSQQLVLDEVLTAYDQLGARPGLAAPPGPERLPFAAYLDWLSRQDLAAAEQFWRSQLGSFTPDPATAAVSVPRAARCGTHTSKLSEQDSDRLRQFGRQHGLTMSSIMGGGWALLLSQLSGRDDVVFGVTVSGRPPDLLGATEAIGMFVNTLPARVRIDAAADLLSWLGALQLSAAELQRYQFTPLPLAERCGNATGGARLFDSIVVTENFPLHRPSSRVRITRADSAVQEAYPLVVEIRPGPAIQLRLRYDLDRISASQADALIGGLAGYACVISGPEPPPVGRIRDQLAAVMASRASAARAQHRAAAARQLLASRRQPGRPGQPGAP
jgi:nonribosomal peptide synthetase protein BlmV